MTLKRRFRIEINEMTGEPGMLPLWMPGDPYGGVAVAHDILEHPSDGGRLEFQATGGIIWLRGESHYFATYTQYNPDVVHHISGDFIELARMWHGDQIPEPPPTKPAAVEDLIQRAIATGCDYVASEYDEHFVATSEFMTADGRRKICGWIRDGYRRCRRRWRRYGNVAMCRLFAEIERMYVRFDSTYPLRIYAGNDVDVFVDPQNCRCRFELVADPYDY